MPSRQLTSLGLGSNAMMTVPMVVNFATGKTLERLNLAGNLFRTLGFGVNMFPGMSSTLKYLILQRCMIETIHPHTFNDLNVLEYLNLAQNQLNSVIPAIRKPSIRHLDLSFQNCIFHLCFPPFNLDEESFSGMESLKVLYLKGNLREVKANYFLSCPGLEELDISSIYLTHIDRDAFQPLSGLVSLTSGLPSRLWSTSTSPTPRTASSLLSESLSEPELLQTVHMFRSAVQRGTLAIFLPNLRVLNVTCALVRDRICDRGQYQYESPLDPDLLKPLTKIEVLDLSKNGLTAWAERRLDHNLRLRQLSVGYNKFKRITEAMLQDFKNLDYLDMR